ncbi:Thioredoxin domain-containing protein [Paragonimus skrjabini miyazakii]|uniref:Thioredoxin domain-containing protein n=1 Tax=Paragonimus skrjabini miyazakii TaxID=59628 RepID=A0A8S9YW09_9TREM|nr:Thioredoxin domain-containing protein [Paragonimus skrjabini miyazakii]
MALLLILISSLLNPLKGIRWRKCLFVLVYFLASMTNAAVRNITFELLCKLDFEDVLVGANPALIFITPGKCSICERFESVYLEFAADPIYTGIMIELLNFQGDIYHVNSSVVPWSIPLESPVILLADSERKLPYCGYLHHLHLTNAIHQFSNGVRAARLTDANFEHDTQASTGSTTGDWLIIFDLVNTSALQVYDGLAVSLRARGISLGIVDPSKSTQTGKRFDVSRQVSEQPSMLMLHRSQVYRYSGTLKRFDFAPVLQFALNSFHEHQAHAVPRPRMRFDEILDWIVEHYLKLEVQHGSFVILAAGIFVLFLAASSIGLLLVTCFWMAGSFEHAEKADNTGRSSDSMDDEPTHEACDNAEEHRSKRKLKEN